MRCFRFLIACVLLSICSLKIQAHFFNIASKFQRYRGGMQAVTGEESSAVGLVKIVMFGFHVNLASEGIYNKLVAYNLTDADGNFLGDESSYCVANLCRVANDSNSITVIDQNFASPMDIYTMGGGDIAVGYLKVGNLMDSGERQTFFACLRAVIEGSVDRKSSQRTKIYLLLDGDGANIAQASSEIREIAASATKDGSIEVSIYHRLKSSLPDCLIPVLTDSIPYGGCVVVRVTERAQSSPSRKPSLKPRQRSRPPKAASSLLAYLRKPLPYLHRRPTLRWPAASSQRVSYDRWSRTSPLSAYRPRRPTRRRRSTPPSPSSEKWWKGPSSAMESGMPAYWSSTKAASHCRCRRLTSPCCACFLTPSQAAVFRARALLCQRVLLPLHRRLLDGAFSQSSALLERRLALTPATPKGTEMRLKKVALLTLLEHESLAAQITDGGSPSHNLLTLSNPDLQLSERLSVTANTASLLWTAPPPPPLRCPSDGWPRSPPPLPLPRLEPFRICSTPTRTIRDYTL